MSVNFFQINQNCHKTSLDKRDLNSNKRKVANISEGDNNKILENTLPHFKIFLQRTTFPISINLGAKITLYEGELSLLK